MKLEDVVFDKFSKVYEYIGGVKGDRVLVVTGNCGYTIVLGHERIFRINKYTFSSYTVPADYWKEITIKTFSALQEMVAINQLLEV